MTREHPPERIIPQCANNGDRRPLRGYPFRGTFATAAIDMAGRFELRLDVKTAFAIDAAGFSIRVFNDLDSKVAGQRKIGLAVLVA
jgi:hypothetical protein